MAEDLIAKKDVLKETGISYGQLYRWKRIGLIPEAWFIRRSTFTGQETFFPKEKILRRIGEILRFKEEKPLEELVKILAPEAVPEEVTHPSPLALAPIGPGAGELLWKGESYAFPELLALACGAAALRAGARTAEARLLVDLVRGAEEEVRDPGGRAVILAEKTVEGEGFSVRVALAVLGREPVALDRECRIKVRLELEKVVDELKLALGGERGV